MKRLVLESWLLLVGCELMMRLRGFKTLHQYVRQQQVHTVSSRQVPSRDICHAIDLACVFYFKPVRCLQRSAAATVLLRRYGWRGEMVIGAQVLPFKSHAWVEIGGTVVNDKPYVIDIYHVLERC